jgi:hypothetical protein
MIKSIVFLFAILCANIRIVSAHGRWKCPPPRDTNDENGKHIKSDNTGNKYPACGPESGKWGFGTVTTLQPGWTTFTWEESVNHNASPFRIAILDENEKLVTVLLDHIPHNQNTQPVLGVEKTYAPYKMSINVPDIQCDKCTLQFLYVMTDKSVGCGIPTCYYNPDDAACKGSTDPAAPTCTGAPNDNVCVQENECFSNYHSCSDVVLTGSIPHTQFAQDSQPEDWPYNSKHMTMQYYGAEIGDWSADAWLQGLPANYTTQYDVLTC